MADYIIATSSTSDLPRTWLDEHRIPFILESTEYCRLSPKTKK
jgi:hypothetical protein